MSKINATYSSGYYLGPDADYRKLEDERSLAQRKRRRQGDDKAAHHKDGSSSSGGNDNSSAAAVGDEAVKRQTFALPFDVLCLACNRRVVRGTHVYANRRATAEKYLDAIRIWSLAMRCRFCQAVFTLHTDPATAKETGGYVCVQGCRRIAGDYDERNRRNAEAAAAAAAAAAEAAANPLEALERENDAARALAERNRSIEEDVEANAEADDRALLHALRSSSSSSLSLTARATRGMPAVTTTTTVAAHDDDDMAVADEVDNVEGDGDGDGDEARGVASSVRTRHVHDMQAIARGWHAQLAHRRRAAAPPATTASAPAAAAATPVTMHSLTAAHNGKDDEVAVRHALLRRYHGQDVDAHGSSSSSSSSSHHHADNNVDSVKGSVATATDVSTAFAPARRNVFVLADDEENEDDKRTVSRQEQHARVQLSTPVTAATAARPRTPHTAAVRKHATTRSALQRLLQDEDE